MHDGKLTAQRNVHDGKTAAQQNVHDGKPSSNKMQEVTMKQKIIALATFLIALLVVTGLFVALVMGATLQELLTPLLVLLVGYLIIFLRQEKGG